MGKDSILPYAKTNISARVQNCTLSAIDLQKIICSQMGGCRLHHRWRTKKSVESESPLNSPPAMQSSQSIIIGVADIIRNQL